MGDPPAVQRRLVQLAGLLDEASGLLAARYAGAAEFDRQVKESAPDPRHPTTSSAPTPVPSSTRIQQEMQHRRTPPSKPDLENGKRLFAHLRLPPRSRRDRSRRRRQAVRPVPARHPPSRLPLEPLRDVQPFGPTAAWRRPMPSFEEGSRRGSGGRRLHLFAERWPRAEAIAAHSAVRASPFSEISSWATSSAMARRPACGATSCRRRDEPIARPGDSSVETRATRRPAASVRLAAHVAGRVPRCAARSRDRGAGSARWRSWRAGNALARRLSAAHAAGEALLVGPAEGVRACRR